MASRFDRTSGRRYNYTFALAGLPGVGKTTIFRHVQNNVENVKLTSSYSEGLDCCAFPVTLDGIKYQITLYDTGGMERFNSLTSNYYQSCQGIILVYSNAKEEETVSGLSLCVESAVDYNSAPDLLVFALWGSVLDKSRDTPMSELATSFGDNCLHGRIPDSLRCTVCMSDGEGIIDGLYALVRAVADVYKPRADSVLPPVVTDYSQEVSQEVIGPRQMEMSQEHTREKHWCLRC